MLVVAIILSLLATWFTFHYLQIKEKKIEADVNTRAKQSRGAMTFVVVPTSDLKIGTVLDNGVVASREVLSDFVYDDTITVEQFDALKGQALIRPVSKGRPLRKGDIRQVFKDFAASLENGKRAMTIDVDEGNSVSHMVQPGDMVDLMLIMSDEGKTPDGGAGGGQTVVPFLDKIKVLATGQKIVHDDPGQQNTSDAGRITYSNMTIEVTSTQAARLALAMDIGKIRAILRNSDDKETVDYDTVNKLNLLEDIRERAKATAKFKPAATRLRGDTSYVEYIIGGKNSTSGVSQPSNVPLPGGISLTPGGVSIGGAALNAAIGNAIINHNEVEGVQALQGMAQRQNGNPAMITK